MLMIKTGYSQEIDLSGDIQISKKGKYLIASLLITNYETTSLTFALSKRGQINDIKINGNSVRLKKHKPKGINCVVYETNPIELSITDTITLNYRIKAKTNSLFKNRHDYKGEISLNDGILRASEQSKWIPIFIAKSTKYINDYSWKSFYNYDLRISLSDTGFIYLNNGNVLMNSGRFISKQSTENLLLIAGDFETSETENTLFIGEISESDKTAIDELIEDIGKYYFELSNIEMTAKFTFAHLPSDNPKWGGFFTYPTMVNVNRRLNLTGLESYLSHEMAHYYFGGKFQPKGILSLLYIEAFAEYYSLKYRISKGLVDMPNDCFKQFEKKDYIKLSTIENSEDISDEYRYEVFPYLLLELEKVVGEDKMQSFIKKLFELIKIEDNYGVNSITEALKLIGVEDMERSHINDHIFNKNI